MKPAGVFLHTIGTRSSGFCIGSMPPLTKRLGKWASAQLNSAAITRRTTALVSWLRASGLSNRGVTIERAIRGPCHRSRRSGLLRTRARGFEPVLRTTPVQLDVPGLELRHTGRTDVD